MRAVQHPIFEILDEATSEGVLRRNHVGRIAFVHANRVDVEPISYVYADGWIHGRTSPGTKLTALHANPWVAVEVDEIEDASNWQSVVVHGTVYFGEPNVVGAAHEAYDTTLTKLREVNHTVLSDEDSAPHRRELFRVHVDEMTGRAATTHFEVGT
ncbi:MAG TPA: pyridoxamine 5'-phosphate oxidase family protein [Gemmatimonadaceae bacterium]|nr:pyridoxamine 5'-phosphate oxidase family protein [Gemmatimonadaceae bacterium]